MYFSQFVIFSSLNLASTGLITVEDQDRVSAEICTSGEQLMYNCPLGRTRKRQVRTTTTTTPFSLKVVQLISQKKTVDLKNIFYIFSNLHQAL